MFSDKAEDLYNELKKEQEIARGRALLSYDNAIESADKMNDLRAMSNYMAKGGKIHIKPENRGKFTALKEDWKVSILVQGAWYSCTKEDGYLCLEC